MDQLTVFNSLQNNIFYIYIIWYILLNDFLVFIVCKKQVYEEVKTNHGTRVTKLRG